MKNIITLLALLIISSQSLFSQTKISTDERMDGVWSYATEKWEVVKQNNDDHTYFEFNEDFTFLTHKTSSAVSVYKIDLQEYDDKHNHYNFAAVSEVGNKYNMIVDYENRRIRFIYKDSDEQMRIVQHHIKDLAYID